MTEVIVAKAGGTSNATAEAVEQSLWWAEKSDIFVVSAPGKVEADGLLGNKVTDLLLRAHGGYLAKGAVPHEVIDAITQRYEAIVQGLGTVSLNGKWIDDIRPRVEESVRHSEDAASMLGERLQAEVYQSLGFTLLDPARAPHDLEDDPDKWHSWLAPTAVKGPYVLPGNTTKRLGQLVTFDRGGSDISGGLAAYGVEADLNWNLTDGAAKSADPRLIPSERVLPVDHMLYAEGRELGRNGTGLVHHAAMVPLMRGNIPTEIRSTFDPLARPTVMDNNITRAEERSGEVVALSLMKNVVLLPVYEPGMAEATGRLAEFDHILAENGVPIIDSQGDGVDGQKYFVAAKHADTARAALSSVVRHGKVDMTPTVDMVTMVGYDLQTKVADHITDVIANRLDAKEWQRTRHDLSLGRHSLRLSVDPKKSGDFFDRLHAHYIEKPFAAK